MLPSLSKSSVEAPSIISRRSARYRTTKSGLVNVGAGDEGGWPLAPWPGETTSMMEERGLSVDLHEVIAQQSNSNLLSLMEDWPTRGLSVLKVEVTNLQGLSILSAKFT